MRKIVVNKSFGGFGLSDQAILRYGELANIPITQTGEGYRSFYIGNPEQQDYFIMYTIPRDDIALVKTVEEMGESANDIYSNLAIVEIPNDVEWEIMNIDGKEWIAEKHRRWKP